MNIRDYDSNIQELYKKIIEKRAKYDTEAVSFLDKLIEIAKQLKDYALIGYCHYYYSEIYCMYIFDPAKFKKNIIEAMKYLQKANEFSQLARCYNVLGIDAMLHGNISVALDYFLAANNYSENDTDTNLHGVVLSNISNIYFQIADYKKALNFCLESRKVMDNFRDDTLYTRNILLSYNMAVQCYQALPGGAARYLTYMEEELENAYILENSTGHPFEINDRIYLSDIEIRVFHFMNDIAKRNLAISTMLDYLATANDIDCLVDDLCDTASFVLSIGETEYVKEFLKLLRPEIDKITIANIKLKIVELEIKYQKTIGNEKEYLEYTALYYELNTSLKDNGNKAFKSSVEIRQLIDKMQKKQDIIEKENIKLVKQASFDELTSLPNRYTLTKYSEEAFKDAFENSTSLAIEILDVDLFKKYNDTFGHQEGDECLKMIAGAISRICASEEGIFAARYGGDEFIIIYKDRTDAEVIEIAEKLRTYIDELEFMEFGNSSEKVTISQGICNSVPEEGNGLWDYMHIADMALYNVKRTNKGRIILRHYDYEECPNEQFMAY